MLLTDPISQENSIYYNSMFVLQSLRQKDSQPLMDLYSNVKLVQNMPFSKFMMCLDWLYLLDIAHMNDKGEVVLVMEALKLN